MSLIDIITTGIEVHNILRREKNKNPLAEAWSNNLTGACAIGSKLLQQKLLQKGIVTEFHKGEVKISGKEIPGTHCWLVHNDMIVDVTVTQMGAPLKVFTGKWNRSVYRSNASGDAALEAVEKHWPEDQTPNSYPHLFE